MAKPKHEQMNFRGLEIVADKFTGEVDVDVSGLSITAADVSVAAGTDGLAAGTLQAALQALASRIAAIE